MQANVVRHSVAGKLASETRATIRHPDETTRDLFFSFLNSGEADMLSGQASETTQLTLSRPERNGCGNGLPNPVTGAHGLAVIASSSNDGHHALKQPAAKGGEAEHLRDCRRTPIRFMGYSISYRRAGVTAAGGSAQKFHAHVRIDDDTYRKLRDRFVDLATHRTAETLAHEFGRIPFARYAPIRRQLLNILRAVNERRKQQSFELLPHNVLKLKRIPVPVYVRLVAETQNLKPSRRPPDL